MQQKWKTSEKCIMVVIVLLSLFAVMAKLFVGFDIDEGYAISMPQRLLQGDHLFLDMWEVHQTSSFLPAIMMGLYESITKSTDGIVLCIRVVATLLHLGMSILVWKQLSSFPAKWRLLFALLYFNMLPKWMMSLDFSMQQIWGLTLVTISLHQMRKTGSKLQAFLTGIFLAMTVLAYPGMVVLYPAIVAMILFRAKGEMVSGKEKGLLCLWFTMGCLLMAIFFFIYTLSAMSLDGLLESIPLVFLDGTHQFTISTKLMAYLRQWLNVCKQLLILGIPSAILAVIGKKITKSKMTFFIWLSICFSAVTSILMIVANLIGIQIGPFHFQVRYLGFYLLCFILAWGGRKEHAQLFVEIFLCNLVAFLGILFFSNVGPDSSSSYLVLGMMGGFAILQYLTKRDERMEKLLWVTCAIFVISLIFCKGYYVRITEYGPANILSAREQMTKGPLKGIWLLPEDHARNTADYDTIVAVTDETTSLLYLGTEGISNLYATGKFVSPSTISTPAFNEQWTLYFTMYPDKQPDVIVLAKNTIDNREKFFAKNPFGIWIQEKYDTMHMEETDSVCVIRRK